MEFLIVSFRSRAETMRFVDILRGMGVTVSVVNTPREAYVGCGLSAQLDFSSFALAKRVAFTHGFESFAGFFKVTERYGRRTVQTI